MLLVMMLLLMMLVLLVLVLMMLLLVLMTLVLVPVVLLLVMLFLVMSSCCCFFFSFRDQNHVYQMKFVREFFFDTFITRIKSTKHTHAYPSHDASSRVPSSCPNAISSSFRHRDHGDTFFSFFFFS